MKIRTLTLHHPASSMKWYDAGLWTTDTFYGLLALHAEQRPEAFALRDAQRRLTWAELQTRVDDMSVRLRALRLRPGSRVSLLMSNRVEAVISALAAVREGLVVNPSLHRDFAAVEVGDLLQRLDAKVLVLEPGYGADRARDLADHLRQCMPGIHIEELPQQRMFVQDPMLAVQGDPPPDDPDAVAYLAFTSGTTGLPKGVMHSQNTLLANARDMVAAWGVDETKSILCLGPSSHHIFWVGVCQALIVGAEFILNDPPEGASTLAWVCDTEATYLMGVPTHAVDLLAEQRSRGLERLGKVEVLYMAGAPIPPALAAGLLTQGIKPQNVYGMTENSSHNFTRPADSPETISNTCGQPGRSYELKIVSTEDPDVSVKQGAVGEIAGRGACLMLGYFSDQQATERSFNSNGWFLSGDLGRVDEGGNLEVVGRIKDVIIRGGHNIYPARIEDLAHGHEKVLGAAAVAIPDSRLGEKVCLAITAVPGQSLKADEILKHLAASGLPVTSMPEFYLPMNEFPRTGSGKILKRRIQEMIATGDAKPMPCRYRESS